MTPEDEARLDAIERHWFVEADLKRHHEEDIRWLIERLKAESARADQAESIAADWAGTIYEHTQRIAELEARPCPHVHGDEGGTQWCDLAEKTRPSAVAEAEARSLRKVLERANERVFDLIDALAYYADQDRAHWVDGGARARAALFPVDQLTEGTDQ